MVYKAHTPYNEEQGASCATHYTHTHAAYAYMGGQHTIDTRELTLGTEMQRGGTSLLEHL